MLLYTASFHLDLLLYRDGEMFTRKGNIVYTGYRIKAKTYIKQTEHLPSTR